MSREDNGRTSVRKLDLVGSKFGKLTVVSQDSSRANGIHWLCLCDCGKSTICDTITRFNLLHPAR